MGDHAEQSPATRGGRAHLAAPAHRERRSAGLTPSPPPAAVKSRDAEALTPLGAGRLDAKPRAGAASSTSPLDTMHARTRTPRNYSPALSDGAHSGDDDSASVLSDASDYSAGSLSSGSLEHVPRAALAAEVRALEARLAEASAVGSQLVASKMEADARIAASRDSESRFPNPSSINSVSMRLPPE